MCRRATEERTQAKATVKKPKNPRLFEFRLGLFLLSFLLLLLCGAYFFSPYTVGELNAAGKFAPCSRAHPLGTDQLSRDLLTRVGQGASGTLLVALGTVTLGACFGLLLGGLGGYFGRRTDWFISRLNDSLLAFPGILMALLVVSAFGRGIPQLIVALGIAFTPSFARLARTSFLQYRNRNFVKRLEIMGAHPLRIVFVHILPLLREQYLNAIGLGLANAILAESGMSFLGFGIQPPRPSWGSMLAEAQPYFLQSPRLALIPGLAVTMTVLGLFLIRRGSSLFWRRGEEDEG